MTTTSKAQQSKVKDGINQLPDLPHLISGLAAGAEPDFPLPFYQRLYQGSLQSGTGVGGDGKGELPSRANLTEQLVQQRAQYWQVLQSVSSDQRQNRLKQVRAILHQRRIDWLVVNRQSQYFSEQLPLGDEVVQWLSGFSGSFAWLVVGAMTAAIFTDSRYLLQIKRQVAAQHYQNYDFFKTSPYQWLSQHLQAGDRVAIDGSRINQQQFQALAAAVTAKNNVTGSKTPSRITLVNDIFARIWQNRPPHPLSWIRKQPTKYCGESSAAKITRITKHLTSNKAQAYFVNSSDVIAWLLNIRARDVECDPLWLVSLLIYADKRIEIFCDQPPVITQLFELPQSSLAILARAQIATRLGQLLASATNKVLYSPQEFPQQLIAKLGKQKAQRLISCGQFLDRSKARKNKQELHAIRATHIRDGAYMARLLAAIARAPDANLRESDLANKIIQLRSRDTEYLGESFKSIVAYGANAALPHYRVSAATDCLLRSGNVFLIDCGAQYQGCTTDITRTIQIGTSALPRGIATAYTRVLQGMIAISRVIFPEGTTGGQLDSLARAPLWSSGLNFDHGVGHGVGAHLCVHESPYNIAPRSKLPLCADLVLSNEPGFYCAGEFGIRIENLICSYQMTDLPYPFTPTNLAGASASAWPQGEADKVMLGFETLTFCPLERRLIRVELLSAAELQWINDYHAEVAAKIIPYLRQLATTTPAEAQEIAKDIHWVSEACARL